MQVLSLAWFVRSVALNKLLNFRVVSFNSQASFLYIFLIFLHLCDQQAALILSVYTDS